MTYTYRKDNKYSLYNKNSIFISAIKTEVQVNGQ